jgi:RsiW-degrading membrane proteinase PrsW (M82 family)
LTSETISTLRTVGFVLAGSIFWLEYWDLKDRRRREPRARLLIAFLLGMVSAGIALALYAAVTALGLPTEPGSAPPRAFLVCVLVVGPIEEGAKYLVARGIVFRWKTFDERVDGFVYAAAIALGFAAYENFLYLPDLSWGGQVVRTLCAPLVHTLFAALWGWGAAHAALDVKDRGRRVLWNVGSLAAAAFVHGVYDFALCAGAPPPAVAGIVLGLWAAVILGARRALRLDDRDALRQSRR